MIRKVICECGNDTYLKTYRNKKPIWICINCNKETSRNHEEGDYENIKRTNTGNKQ